MVTLSTSSSDVAALFAPVSTAQSLSRASTTLRAATVLSHRVGVAFLSP